jgi:hypothetical protein
MEREPSARGYNWATLFLGGYKYGDLVLQVGGVSRIGTIKYAREFCGTARARPAETVNYRPALSLERAPLINKPVTV